MHYQFNEHFWSIQGEGVHAGSTAVFLRLQGCPVGCKWCDSKLTWYAGGEYVEMVNLPDIVNQYPASDLLVVTGGEPLIYDLDALFKVLRQHFPDRAIHVETSGAYPYKGRLRPDWTTLSPKYPVEYRVAGNVLTAASELKYVVDEHFSPEIVGRHALQLQTLGLPMPPVVLMPEGCPPRPQMVARVLELLREHGEWRFGPRLQYDYSAVAEGEGGNNRQVSESVARSLAAHRRRSRHGSAIPALEVR